MKRSNITDEMVCRAYAKWSNEECGPEDFPYDLIMRETGAPMKVAYAAMERAFERGLLDYGISLRSGWLTDKGKALLKAAA